MQRRKSQSQKWSKEKTEVMQRRKSESKKWSKEKSEVMQRRKSQKQEVVEWTDGSISIVHDVRKILVGRVLGLVIPKKF